MSDTDTPFELDGTRHMIPGAVAQHIHTLQRQLDDARAQRPHPETAEQLASLRRDLANLESMAGWHGPNRPGDWPAKKPPLGWVVIGKVPRNASLAVGDLVSVADMRSYMSQGVQGVYFWPLYDADHYKAASNGHGRAVIAAVIDRLAVATPIRDRE